MFQNFQGNNTKSSQPAPKILTRQENQSIESEEVDSDEEFFVHKALLPFRKSKSTAFGFMHSAKPDPLTGIDTERHKVSWILTSVKLLNCKLIKIRKSRKVFLIAKLK